MSSPMQPLIEVGHRPHPIDTKKYGRPRFAVYFADKGFLKPGIYVWFGSEKHGSVRLLPLPRRLA